MPGAKADGSITIDTKLDNSGFSKGSNELKRAVKSLTDQVNETGGKLRNAFKFDFGQPKQVVNSFSRAIKQVNDEIKDLGELGKRALDGDADALERFRSESGDTLEKLEEMKTELEKFGSAEFETPEHAEAAEQYQKAAAQVDELTKSLTRAENAWDTLINDFESSDKVMGLKGKIADLKKWKSIYDKAGAIGDYSTQAKAYTSSGVSGGSIADALKETEAELEKVRNSFESSRPFKAAQREVEKISENLEIATNNATRYKEQMDATPATFKGSDSTEYEKDQAALQKTIDKLLEYRQLVQEGAGDGTGASAEWEAVQEKWQNMTTLSGIIRNAFIGLFNTLASGARTVGSALSTGITHPIQLLDRVLGGVASGAWKAVSALGRLAGNAIVSGIRNIADAARRAALHLASMAKRSIINGLKKLGNAISNVGKNSRKTNASMSESFKTMLKQGLKIGALIALFNKLRTVLGDGFNSLAAQDTTFATVINNFKASLKTLKNSFAAAFAPIVEVVLPMLTSLINALSATIAKVGQLTAALTGKTTFKKATMTQVNMAANTNEATDAINNETKAAKKAQKTLAGFDDVEILHDNSDKSSTSTLTPNKGQAAGGDFTDAPIENKIKGLANALKEMWKNADFTNLGRMVGEKLKGALESIPWGKIKATLRKIGKSIATFLNGFLETPGLFTTIGKTIAEALNSAFEFVDAFVSNLHWGSLGKAIKDLILGALNNIDWPLIYKTMTELGSGIGTALQNALNNLEVWSGIFTTISKWLNAIIYGIEAFLTSVNWANLGSNIGNGLNEGIAAFDWNALSQSLIHFVNGAFDLWYNFITTFDFFKFGSYIGTALSDAIRGIDWVEGGAGVAETINGLFRALNGFIQSTDWKALGKAIIDAVAGFFGALDWATFAETLSGAIKGLFDTLTGAIEEINWAELPRHIVDAISTFFSEVDWEGIAKATGELIGAAFAAIVAVGGELWKSMKECGKNIMDGGFQGIIDALANIGTWIKIHIFDPFIGGFKAAFGIASPAKNMMPLGGYIIGGLLQGVVDGLKNIGSWVVTNVFDPIKNGINKAFDIASGIARACKDVGSSIINGISDGMSSTWDTVLGWIEKNAPGLKSAFDNQDWNSIGQNICAGIQSGLQRGWNWLTKTAWDVATNVYDSACRALGINSPSKEFAWIGEMITEGLGGGINATQDNAVDAVTSLADAVMQEAEETSPIMQIDTAVSGIDGVLSTFSDKVVRNFDAMISAMGDIVNGSSLTMPAMANGSVMPYSARRAASQGDGDNLSSLIETLAQRDADRLTRDDLNEVLISVLRQYLNIDFYIGDEQIARHANAGNAKLNRRYSTAT